MSKKITLSDSTIKQIQAISGSWNWDNYRSEKGRYWTIMQALYCKLSWVAEILQENKEYEEYSDIIFDTQQIIEALQKDIKI